MIRNREVKKDEIEDKDNDETDFENVDIIINFVDQEFFNILN